MPRAAPKRKTSSRAPGFSEEVKPFAHEEIVRGISARDVQDLIDRGMLSAKQVYRVIPERTFLRRLASGEPLKTAEGDAIARLLRVIGAAYRTFGNADFARQFLNLPNPALGDRIPNELAETDAGAREVEAILSHIAYGDFS